KALGLARDAIEQGDGPRLVYLHVAPPHMPYQPPAPFRGRFSAATDALAHVDGSIASARAIHRAHLEPEHPDVQRLAMLYDEHVAWADERLGRFLESVRALPRARSLVIVWTSDHGEAFMEHGQQGHNSSAYDEMLRVPLAIRGPGLAPRRVEAPASLLDLAPTLLELCGLPPLENARGLSLVPTLRDGSAIPERTLFASSRHYSAHPERLRLAAIHGSSKLILAPSTGTEEFFDLATDPHERHPLSPDFPAASALRRALAASPLLAPPEPDPAASLDFDADPPDPEELRRRRRLRELGYVDDN
ncbi:MAG: sulfatase-like hydrolase/transferase, partial [Planctomycetota bacterium]|nr:sulfatase-like hydrolase/transferase [Planctomycetota bacterium]